MKRNRSRVLVTLAMLASAGGTLAAERPARAPENPIAVGTVAWRRDLDAALEESARSGKPVLAFFQEVPGCAGCQKFGASVMSHDPIVAAIEREFLPVLIYNNRAGRDAETLKRYGEPAWNFQVIRFLDGRGNDLIPRKDRVWTREALASRMIEALAAAGRPVPRFLEVTAYEPDADRQATVAFAQSCFWSGEVALGRVGGVITTEAGWIEGREVTLVHYRPDLVSLDTLIDLAADAGVADKVYLPERELRQRLERERRLNAGALGATYRRSPDSDQKRQLRGSALSELELSPMQQTKVNAFVTLDMQEALAWLTPAQRHELERLKALPAVRSGAD